MRHQRGRIPAPARGPGSGGTLQWPHANPAVWAPQPATPRYTPRGCQHVGLVKENPSCPILLLLGGAPGAQGIWEPEPSLCSLLPVCAELRPAALTTLSSNVAPVCSLDKAPCPTCGRHAASPEPTGIPLSQGWASSFSCTCDELWQVSAAGPCCHHAGDPLPLPRQQRQE